MCQLLGMNCNVPTDICFSFSGFQQRGGATDIHTDGWGIAFYEGKGVRLFLDAAPSAQSTVAELVRQYPIHSLNVIAHIRKATQGIIRLENTHPFQRELWGRNWIFAHNGDLPQFKPKLDGSFRPIGNTDSELICCWLLQRLRHQFGDQEPTREELFDAVHELSMEIAGMGIFNFLLSNGDCLIAHSSTELHYIIRCAPFNVAQLKDDDIVVDFNQLTTPRDRVAIITTRPLTVNEDWIEMQPGSLWLFHDGEVLDSRKTIPSPIKTLNEKILTKA